jgi:hypothetical protein
LRAHALFLAAVAVGVAVRVVVMVAYRPAMMFPDAYFYLRHAKPLSYSTVRPVGYSVFIRPLLELPHPLAWVAVAHHLLGLGLAVACYVFLLRRGLPRWGATLAALPVLLDPLQLVLEHYVLSDVLFEALLVAACLVLLWRHRPGLWAVVTAGVLVGTAGTVRGAGEFLLAAFLVAVLCLRLGWVKVLAFLVAGIVPLAGYALGFHAAYGEYAVTTSGPRFLYARLAPIVHCRDPELRLPRYERPLCPDKRIRHRPSSDWYMWGGQQAAQYHVTPPPGMTQVQVVKDFDKRVVRAQPGTLTASTLSNLAGGFAPSRTHDVPGFPASYWLFDDHYWSLDRFISTGVVQPQALRGTGSDPGAAQVMTTYRRWIWTPGPLLGVALLMAAVAVLGVGRARRSGDRVAVGLLAGTCLLTLLTAAGVSGFSWRYQLPQLALLPPAGALALAALVRGRAPGRPDPAPVPPLLDRTAALVTGWSVPVGWRPALRRAAVRGRLQATLAVLAGLAAGCGFGGPAALSGWFDAGPAALVGAVLGVLVVAGLLVARSRGGSAASLEAGRPVRADCDEPAVPVGSGR